MFPVPAAAHTAERPAARRCPDDPETGRLDRTPESSRCYGRLVPKLRGPPRSLLNPCPHRRRAAVGRQHAGNAVTSRYRIPSPAPAPAFHRTPPAPLRTADPSQVCSASTSSDIGPAESWRRSHVWAVAWMGQVAQVTRPLCSHTQQSRVTARAIFANRQMSDQAVSKARKCSFASAPKSDVCSAPGKVPSCTSLTNWRAAVATSCATFR